MGKWTIKVTSVKRQTSRQNVEQIIMLANLR